MTPNAESLEEEAIAGITAFYFNGIKCQMKKRFTRPEKITAAKIKTEIMASELSAILLEKYGINVTFTVEVTDK